MKAEEVVLLIIEDKKRELGYVTREIEKWEGQHAFLLQKRKKLEDLIAELRLCLKVP